MRTDRINEALALFDSQGWSHSADLKPLADAARAYLRDWITCPTCNGSGNWRVITATFDGWQACPDCVDGLTPSPALIGRVRQAGYAVYGPDEVDEIDRD